MKNKNAALTAIASVWLAAAVAAAGASQLYIKSVKEESPGKNSSAEKEGSGSKASDNSDTSAADKDTYLLSEVNNGEAAGNAAIENISEKSVLKENEILNAGEMLINEDYALKMQEDGNLVVCNTVSEEKIFESQTSGSGNYAKMQADGNFVVCNSSDKALWGLGTNGINEAEDNYSLYLGNNGNFFVYDEDKGTSIFGLELTVEFGDENKLDSGKIVKNGKNTLSMQSDGNFVVKDSDGNVKFKTGTSGAGNYAKFLPDGNLAIYDKSDKEIWTSKSNQNGTSHTYDMYFTYKGTIYIWDYDLGKEIWNSDSYVEQKTVAIGADDASEADNNNNNTSSSSRFEVLKVGAVPFEGSRAEAEEMCSARGGHLPTIGSEEEWKQLTAVADSSDLKYFWMGGTTDFDESGIIWVTWDDNTSSSFIESKFQNDDYWFHSTSTDSWEPSGYDAYKYKNSGELVRENYLILWHITENTTCKGWSLNDTGLNKTDGTPHQYNAIIEYDD